MMPAGFLQGSIEEKDAGANRAGIRVGPGGIEQGVQPPGFDFGVVVEEDEELAAGSGRGVVVPAAEAEIQRERRALARR